MNGQTPVIIPSHTYVADHDPNMRKNRIPTESELSGLKGIANTLTKSIQDMEEDITRAQEAHESLLAKYQQQFRELEGTQSQLHESKELIEFLQKQCRNFKVKSDRLSGIIHPIRRCPTDVLQYIFELACQMSNSTHIISAAVRLSHVCQRWRTIALDTPRLWCCVTFSLLRGSSQKLFWNIIIHRMRHAPASIVLLDLDEAGSTRLKHYKLQRIPVISSLTLGIMEPDYFSRIKSLRRLLPSSGVKHLRIDHIPPEDMPDGLDTGTWDMGDLLENIPPVRELELNAPCELITAPSSKLTTLTWLQLHNMLNFNVLSTLSLLSSLSYLSLHDVGFTPVLDTSQVVSNTLKLLKLSNSEVESWLERLSCPNLDTFLVGCVLNLDLYTSFIKAHTSITYLDMCANLDNIASLTSIASHAQTLVVDSDLSLLYKRKVPRVKGVPFPGLVRLVVDTTNITMTLGDFEGVTRARCLPRGHRLSKLTASLKPLAALSIRRDPSDPGEEPWRESELFRSAKKTVERDAHWDAELLTLSWV